MNSHESRARPGVRATKAMGAVPASPREGDLLLEPDPATRRYTIRQVPAAVQISASSRDEAVRVARRFAQKHAVDIWYQDTDRLRLLEAYRVDRGSSSQH